MARKYTIRNKEEKLAIVKRNLAGEASLVLALERETGIAHRHIIKWTEKYLTEGEAGLENKKKPGNPLTRYERKKELAFKEQLLYQIEVLKGELAEKEEDLSISEPDLEEAFLHYYSGGGEKNDGNQA